MKRSPMPPRPSRLPSRGKGGLRPRKAIKRKKRSSAEYERIYGSEARVRWIKFALPCVGCGRIPDDEHPNANAHTANEGKSRKGHHTTIAPLCTDTMGRVGCHTKYDQHRAPFVTALAREAVRLHAAFTAARWERMGEGLEPISAIVPRVMDDLLEGNE